MQKEWTPQEGMIPALSIQQPYASGIIHFKVKTMELRTWATAYQGPIATHAGKTWVGGAQVGKKVDRSQVIAMKDAIDQLGLTSYRMGDYPTGGIIGVAYLAHCVKFRDEKHFQVYSPVHKVEHMPPGIVIGWQFTDVIALAEPIEVRGHLGLFPVDRGPLEEALAQMEVKR